MCYELTCLCFSPKGFAQPLPWGYWSTGQGLHACCPAGWLPRLPLVHWSTATAKQRRLKKRFGNLNPVTHYTQGTLEKALRMLPCARGVWPTVWIACQMPPSWPAPAGTGCVSQSLRFGGKGGRVPLPVGAGCPTHSNAESHLGEAAGTPLTTSPVFPERCRFVPFAVGPNHFSAVTWQTHLHFVS